MDPRGILLVDFKMAHFRRSLKALAAIFRNVDNASKRLGGKQEIYRNIFSGFLSALAVSAGVVLTGEGKRIVKVHTLTQPLIILISEVSASLHHLPAGATLYFDKSFPEGFTRYKVYVNVDRLPLTLRELSNATEIDPLEARAFVSQVQHHVLPE